MLTFLFQLTTILLHTPLASTLDIPELFTASTYVGVADFLESLE